MKDITDVVEYLLKNNQKELARVVIKELQNKPPKVIETRQLPPIQAPVDPFKPYRITSQGAIS